MVVQPAVPEIVENEIHESINARTESLQSLRELGPPDLVHLIKSQPKAAVKEIGTYHHVIGVDASSSASLAAYINTLTYSIGENQMWFGRPQAWRITTGIYCCYNAFSRVDMRVNVTIPGTVDAYAVDERGEKRKATDELWLETYLCSVLRAFSYAEEGATPIIGCRKFNPITSTEVEHKFLDAAERLFFKGYQLGSDPEVQVPNVVSNHLTAGLLAYIHTTGRFASGVNLFEKLRSKEPEVASLLARVLIDADEEVKAVQLLYDTVKLLPMDNSLLDVQAEFCMNKGRYDLALECAKRAVNSAPSEFTTWERLAQVYLKLEQYELALLTLNSCPMFTFQDRDVPKMPPANKMHLPVLQESVLEEMNEEHYDPKHDQVDPLLLKLPAAHLKGTFAKAYKILTEITSQIGWDTLLKCRSSVFVMEEEYREEKKNSSVATLRGTPRQSEERPSQNGDNDEDQPATNGSGKTENEKAEETLPEKPESSVPPELKHGEELEPDDDRLPAEKYTHFQNKRLCERWLDNLFMVLYEDLRVYTIWRSEYAQYKAQSVPYKKNATEWEILGELAQRLQHHDEALEAFNATLKIRFSPRALKGILSDQERRKDSLGALNSIIKLTAWQYRWYSEFSPSLLFSIRRLIAEEGAVKVRSIVQATNYPQSVLDLTHHYALLCMAFRSSGSDG
ncbi:Chs5p-Arf1p-binding proteins-domain-containing protein [Sphaerosporella brunnea]|uniref:Chs5p-Arf1p-binding proteins-domain-containing protein n=1 Tax=Sphaerosporella brunnea TaxID=1250544 RepID=A0A5J5EBQ6_9PEZI|nr:Chs5p-Arf1p-binding proteins-domain-containing protein [Sphaerosporella brunnea]